MKVRYAGESTTGVEVVHPDPEMPGANTVTVCPPGEDVELPDDIAVPKMATGEFAPADKRAEAALRRHQRAAGTPEPLAGTDAGDPSADDETSSGDDAGDESTPEEA